MNVLPPAIFLMGPTAAGKTKLAIELSKVLPCELISVDSALVYRDMDIGTSKPAKDLLAQYPHRLIDIIGPEESYSVANFRTDALAAMADITSRGSIPLLVGGTMLYYKSLQEGLAELPSADVQVRTELEEEASLLGWQNLHDQLAEVDSVSAARIHPNDTQRLMRALEVWRASGKTMTEHRQLQHMKSSELGASGQPQLPYNAAYLVIATANIQVLHERIAQRFSIMLEQGLVNEVVGLRSRGDLHPGLPSMRAVGYRQVWDHLDGNLTSTEMYERSIIATRQLAKRQFTWLRRWSDLHWLDSLKSDNLSRALKYLGMVSILS